MAKETLRHNTLTTVKLEEKPLAVHARSYWNTTPVLAAIRNIIEVLDKKYPGVKETFWYGDREYKIQLAPHPHAPLILLADNAPGSVWKKEYGIYRILEVHTARKEKHLFLSIGQNGYPIGYDEDGTGFWVLTPQGKTIRSCPQNKHEVIKQAVRFEKLLRECYFLPTRRGEGVTFYE